MAARHKHQRLDARHDAAQRIDRFRPLQREQRLIVHMIERDRVGQFVAQMPDIVIFHRTVDDHVQPVFPAGEHQVVEDAAVFGK